MFEIIAFDADDTLWHNEPLYLEAQARLQRLLAMYAPADVIANRLYQIEMRNIPLYGYGIKSFTLSMIEAAIALSGGQVTGDQVGQIIGFARAMLTAEVQIIDGARDTVRRLAEAYRLMLITKGDLLDQQSKLARSGFGGVFQHIEIVQEKSPQIYSALLDRLGIDPQRFLMVGNSLRSDILPVLALGGHAVFVPYDDTWDHEKVEGPPPQSDNFHQLENLSRLPALVERLSQSISSI